MKVIILIFSILVFSNLFASVPNCEEKFNSVFTCSYGHLNLEVNELKICSDGYNYRGFFSGSINADHWLMMSNAKLPGPFPGMWNLYSTSINSMNILIKVKELASYTANNYADPTIIILGQEFPLYCVFN